MLILVCLFQVGAVYPWDYDGRAFAFLGYKSESLEAHFGFIPWIQSVLKADANGLRVVDKSFRLGSYACKLNQA